MTSVRRVIAVVLLAGILAFAVGCEGFLFNKPGTLTVTNTSTTETAVIAVIGDDFKSYPVLGPGASAKVTTEVGGTYVVTVIMSAVDAQTYRNNLQTLKQNVTKVVDGTASNDEKTLFFTYLAGINAAISQAQASGGASCSGRIKVSENEAASVSTTVAWQSTLGSGFWSLTCGSN
jgi:hypothetical protein